MKSIPLLVLLLIAISGCTTSTAIRTPVADSITIEQARQTRQTGKLIRWGGLVVNVEIKSNHSIIEIVEKPLTRQGVPKITKKTGGRFLARSNEFLEPEDIKPGRHITISGQISDYQTGQIGAYEYDYPVVVMNEYKVWPVNNYRPHYRYDPFYHYDPFWGHYPYYFRHHRYHHHYW